MPLTANSDSDDDLDYVPQENDISSDSSDERDGVEGTPKTEPPKPDLAVQKKKRDALWSNFQALVSTSPSTIHANGSEPHPTAMPAVNCIKIEKTYLFAGRHITEVVEVAEDSEEAQKWPRLQSYSPMSGSVGPYLDKRDEHGSDKGDRPTPPLPSSAIPGVQSTATTTATIASALGAKRSGPRRRTILPSIPKTSQAKKISTLDKSAMDWHAHVTSQPGDLKDELDANRRGGGYLEKVDFLKRVKDRREDVFEANRAGKRRKV